MISNFFKKIDRVILSIFFIYASLSSQAQKNEIGIGIGVANYSGEIVQHVDVTNFKPAGQLYYRLNFNRVTALKFSTSIGMLGASDSKYDNAMADYRKASFSTIYNDVTAMFEYNFLDFSYTEKSNGKHFSPYISAGLGILNYKSTISDADYKVNTIAQPIIPFGGGFKYRTNAHFTINFQFTINKTFTDSIDGIYDPAGSTKSITNSNNTDWYYYSGITVGYIFWKVICPQ